MASVFQEHLSAADKHIQETGLHYTFENVGSLSGGDQGDGTYKNYVLVADYSDPDVIRVDDTYYMVTSTFHLNPGLTILESKDLVNWSFTSNAIEDMSVLSPQFSYQAMDGYSAGIWAPSLRYHKGTFYIHVGGPLIGLVVCKANDIHGPWTVERMKMTKPWTGRKLIDCCPFWDDDGKAYFAASEPYNTADAQWIDYHNYIFEMSEDGVTLLDNGVIVHTGWVSEAMKIYKINGWYYLFYSESPGDEGRIRSQYAARSRSIYGPYQICKLVHSHGRPDQGPNQGGLVEDVDGNWWFLCHGMSRAPLSSNGRQLMLLPVYWENGWPMIGEDLDGDGVGEMIWRHKKPACKSSVTPHLPAATDEFDKPELGLQWSWNHKDRPDRWSLTERPGYLRLKACKPVLNGGFYHACNTLTQRIMGETGTIDAVLDTSGMIDGQYAGLCLQADPSLLLGVYQENGKKYIRWQYTRYPRTNDASSTAYDDNFYQKDICEIPAQAGGGTSVYFRMKIRGEKARLYYSLDGEENTLAEDWIRFGFFAWRGGRPGFFTYNEFDEGGVADFDYFRYAIDDETPAAGSVWVE